MSTNGAKKKRNLSPEAREKLSKLAKERHAKGLMGGSEFGKLGGRPRKNPEERASFHVAEAARKDAQKIIRVFKDAIEPNQPMSVRLKAAEAWLGVEREEAKVALQEAEAQAQQHSREELLSILSEKLTSGPAAMILRKQLEAENIPDAEVIDGDATEAA